MDTHREINIILLKVNKSIQCIPFFNGLSFDSYLKKKYSSTWKIIFKVIKQNRFCFYRTRLALNAFTIELLISVYQKQFVITLFLFNKVFVQFVQSEVDEHFRRCLSQVFILIFEVSAIVLRIIQLLLVAHLWESESNKSEYFHNDYKCPNWKSCFQQWRWSWK